MMIRLIVLSQGGKVRMDVCVRVSICVLLAIQFAPIYFDDFFYRNRLLSHSRT